MAVLSLESLSFRLCTGLLRWIHNVKLRRPGRLCLAAETICPIIGSKEALCVTLTRSELIQQAALAVLIALTSQTSGMDGLQPPWRWKGI